MSSPATLTYGQALADWLAHCEDTPDDEEGLKSAKNFARAFNIWYNKAMKPATTYSDQIYPDMLWYNIEQFAWDFELEADPILERLDPGSKTKRIATNYGRFAKYLHERKVVDDNDLKQSTRAVGMLEDDLRRMQRASWVLRQNDVARTFGTKVGNEFRPVSSDERRAILNGENGEDQTYEIAHIGENFVLADKCDDLGCAVSSADNPVKIRLPVSAIMYLKPGDTIDATFEKAKGGDYWVIQMFTGVDSGTDKFEENKLIWTRSDEEIAKYMGPKETYAEKLKAIRSTREYRERWDELLKTAPPADALFPEETFTVEWFEKRETDIGSDDEIGAMWDTTSDGDGEERLDYLE